MDNNLSELSKPVAYTDADELRFHHATSDMWPVPLGLGKDVPLYSQEYVSALDGVAQFWIGESAGWKKRAEDAEKRIAELEEEFAFIMGQNDGMEKELRDKDARIERLEAKLATPVRLPAARFCPAEYEGSLLWSETESYNKAISDCAESLRAAGFVVEGGE